MSRSRALIEPVKSPCSILFSISARKEAISSESDWRRVSEAEAGAGGEETEASAREVEMEGKRERRMEKEAAAAATVRERGLRRERRGCGLEGSGSGKELETARRKEGFIEGLVLGRKGLGIGMGRREQKEGFGCRMELHRESIMVGAFFNGDRSREARGGKGNY
jgi:hypothetical protein